MKINSITSSYYVQNYRSNKLPSIELDRPQNETDRVTFSEEAKSFSRVLSDTKEVIRPRTAEEKTKIDDIKGRIKKGQYLIDSDLVAEKILRLIGK